MKVAKIKEHKYSSLEQINSPILSHEEKEMILHAQQHLNKEFYALLAVFQLQYTVLCNKIYDDDCKHKNVITITQGYDYPIPSPKRRISLRTPLQPLVNTFLDSGNWLYTPLMIKGILDEYTQRSIMFTMIFEFNEMLSSFTKIEKYKVYHVDSRGLTTSHDDWYDELHLKSHVFKRVAKTYEYIIRNHETLGDRRIIRTREVSWFNWNWSFLPATHLRFVTFLLAAPMTAMHHCVNDASGIDMLKDIISFLKPIF